MNISHISPSPLPLSASNYRETMIGHLLLEMGKITPEQIERTLQLQSKEGLRFGEAARKLGFVTQEDIQRALAIQFDYPYLPADQSHFSKELVAAYQPFSPQVEALRALRSQVSLRWLNTGNKALAVISANPGEGCSYLAANLAVVFSQLGEETLLIDANLRQPAQRSMFSLRKAQGLSDILIGRAGVDVISRIDALSNLSVLGAGPAPPNPQELLNRKNLADLLRLVQEIYDVVIIDTPPATLTSDAQAVATRCGGALLVSRLNATPLSDLANVQDQLLVSDVQIVAAVLL